ncbi:MAG: hypothetical protein CR968_00035 [Flavobacteriia bacterium]|nr:MAG: hypothetical protein CR968_00035 [Flavobacteriia bacterium]
MKEDFLHHIWQYQLFNTKDLQTTQGEALSIEKTGYYNQHSGPDFQQAQLTINTQRWAGHVEIHLKSSDWYAHNHEQDDHYNNVILHVVWEDDIPVFRPNKEPISTLELKGLVSQHLLQTYNTLTGQANTHPTCAPYITDVNSFAIDKWLERLYISRLEQKTQGLNSILNSINNDWEYMLFILLARYFGLQRNGECFQQMALHINYNIIQKERHHPLHLEALFMGVTGLLKDNTSAYARQLNDIYKYLAHKYDLKPANISADYYRLRPPNFPTIRLSQLAELYTQKTNIFSQIISEDYTTIHKHLQTRTSTYWQTHYVFDKTHNKRLKKTSASFIDLLIINVVIPLRFAYQHYMGNPDFNSITSLLEAIKPEQNHITKTFKTLGINTENALHSQALITLNNEFCLPKNCLQCAIGLKILKNRPS